MPKKAEYYVTRIKVSIADASGRGFFAVSKIEDRIPTGLYLVIWHHNRDQMDCQCPNRARSAHIDDKHGEVVRQWLADGEPEGKAYEATPQSRTAPKTRRESSNRPYPGPAYPTDPEDDIPF